MKRVLLCAVVAAAVMTAGCTRRDKTVEVLEANGYTNIEITGYNFFSCSEDDAFKTGFEATAPNGTRVEGTVCSGWFKGSTIRLD